MRRYLAGIGAFGIVTAIIVVGFADSLARVLAGVAQGRLDTAALATAVAFAAARGVLVAARGATATSAAATLKAHLRADLLTRALDRGPVWLRGQRAGELATLAGPGVNALDAYLIGYLPVLVTAVTVPVAVLGRLALADRTAALTVALTLPLVPIFAALVGWHTASATRRQWRLLHRLGGHFLDMLTGMTTLRAFGRAAAQVEVVRAMADKHRDATMRTLRLAFLSALVLELLATLSVALVAVPVGVTLLDGGITLPVALLVLLLTPEAFAPLRAAGAQFHASQEGLAALREIFAVREAGPSAPARSGGVAARPRASRIVFDNTTFEYGGQRVLRDVTVEIAPGERIALIGPSGGGKSTLLHALLGFLTPASGRVLVGSTDLADVDLAAWRERIAWVPQRPYLFAASVADNIRLGLPDAPDDAVRAAAAAADASGFVAALPRGYATDLGERGVGLSSGQRQRLGVARAFLRDADLLLLDEPTARLDGGSEAAVIEATPRLLAGRTAVFVAHRPAMLPLADRVLLVRDGTVREVTA
ncbi:thiol reductant ABC exporter subunit CydD [Luedemannella helvata]